MWVTKNINSEIKDDFNIEYLNLEEFSKFIITKNYSAINCIQ